MDWYKDWFNSKYYHILYGKRNEAEAEAMLSKICNLLDCKQNEKALDLGCGKGRHSKYLASLGLKVWGTDLSENSVECAKTFANDNLHFEVQDMRKVYKTNFFDYVFNLFTSFGYFENFSDNLETLKAVKTNLKTEGIFIQDYLNAEIIKSNLKEYEDIEIDGILFKIRKKIITGEYEESEMIVKSINFTADDMYFHFEEKVNLFTLSDFEAMYSMVDLDILNVYGNYNFDQFNPENSERLILISRPQ